MTNSKRLWESNFDYRSYVASHYPEAIEFIRKNAVKLNNKGKIWLDIQDYQEFEYKAPDGAWLPGTRNIILFKKIIVDIFPRKKNPQYVKDNADYNRYITWKTATEDIKTQRRMGYQGERWIINCGLNIRKTADTYRTVYVPEIVGTIKNPEYLKYIGSKQHEKYKQECEEYREKYEQFNLYRKKYHSFILPDGTEKQVLLYLRTEEKFAMLRNLGVSEEKIAEAKAQLIKPEKPIDPAPPQFITGTIPAHDEDKLVEGKWVWHHYISDENIYRK